MFSIQQSIEFENLANPHAWFLVASELHEQAISLKESSSTTITRYDHPGANGFSWHTSNRTVILLAGFALENILKAFLIYDNPDLVKNGFLNNSVRTHSLTKLAQKSNSVPYKSRGYKTLKYYEDGLESWARYPCALNWAQTKEQRLLTDRAWKNYRWLMRAFEKRFKKLLESGWKGPHKFEGSFQVKGSWLG